MISELTTTQTLTDFYENMRLLHKIRTSILNSILNSETISIKDLISLERIKHALEDIPKENGKYKLQSGQGADIFLELDYELGELKKDNIFLKYGHRALKKHMTKIHPDYLKEVDDGLNFLKKYEFEHFITDRDGTVSNYCGRYLSSIQSIYNALSLSEFSKTIQGRCIILTSAPLLNNGLKEVSIQPENEYILSGSKGREIIINGKNHTLPIKENEQQKLDELNQQISKLLNQQEFSVFRHIGSGYQQKFGQITLARQDKNNSIAQHKSLELKQNVLNIVDKIDPEKIYFGVEDTGQDLEIMLKVKSDNNQLKEFDKGNGLKFIMQELNENIDNRTVLICGDTASDVPMLKAAQELGAEVVSVFVTKDESLKSSVRSICKQSYFVSSPDALIYMLFKYSKRQDSWNPLSLFLSLVNKL
jgi:hydroxymethylpyrimidine pyrophosphatase-like HAD family hydrolase